MKTLHFAAMISAATLMLATAVACSDTETEYVTAPSISVAQAVVQADQAGGPYTAALSVTNPVDGATISASPSASWVTVTSCTETAIALSVSENANEDPRTARVTVSYSYTLAGSRGTATCEITVAQGNADQPILSVQPTAVAAAIEGGDYSFEYTVVNPASDGEVSASCSASWISGIDASKDGEVSFSVAENTETTLRQTEITLTYSWGNGSLSESVTVVQDHEGGSGDDSGSGGDGGIVGTYLVSGYTYDGDMTWTMTIHQDTSDPDKYWIDGLTPSDEGNYPYGTSYCAYGHYGSETTFVIPSQVSDWYDSSNGVYLGWTPCTEYAGGSWYYSSQFPDLTFTSKGNDTWVSDYGVFLGAFLSKTLSKDSFDGFFDVVAPSLTITKVSGGDGGSGGGGGGGYDDGSLAGTYTAHGTAYGNGITVETEMDWTVKIYPYEGSLATSSQYDYWYDGVIPWGAGAYDQYGDHRASAGVYVASDGTLHMPSQVANATLSSTSGGTYYLGYTPCTGKSDTGGYQYNTGYPDLVFTYNSSTDVWTSNYGVFMAGCTGTSISSFTSYFQVVIPVITLTKTSDTTSLSAGNDSKPVTSFEGLVPYSNLKASPSPASGSLTVHKTGARAAR